MELHDFRAYQPGDDLRQVDWNAVARTGELMLRVRQDEVSPAGGGGAGRLALHGAVAARRRRARGSWRCWPWGGARQGLEPTLVVTGRGRSGRRGRRAARRCARRRFDARDDLARRWARLPPLRPCGLRVVVSDFLFEADLTALRRAAGARGLGALPGAGAGRGGPGADGRRGARLVDAESGAALEEC